MKLLRRGILSSALSAGGITDGATFNGSTSVLSAPDPAAFASMSQITVCAWVKFDTLATEQWILSQYLASGDRRSFLLFHDGTNLKFNLSSAGTSGTTSSRTLSGITTGVWYFIVGRLSGTSLSLRYTSVNKVSATHSGGIYDDTVDLLVGAEGGGLSLLDGNIILPKVYSRGLSDAELNTLEGGGTPTCTTSLAPSLLVDLEFAPDLYGSSPLLDRSGNGISLSNTDVTFTGTGIDVNC